MKNALARILANKIVCPQGIDSLHGKLREDFYKLLDEARTESISEERKELIEEMAKQLESDFDTKKSELSKQQIVQSKLSPFYLT